MYVCTYIWVIYGVNVGQYSMEHLGRLNAKFLRFIGVSLMFYACLSYLNISL